jgi:sialate O-acetylesterase
VGDWSGTCYYFAREVQRSQGVPVGLVHSAWNGSGIRAWMSADALRAQGGYADALALLRRYADDEAAAQRAFVAQWEAWWTDAAGADAGAEPWQPSTGAAWTPAPTGLGDWTTWDDAGLSDYRGLLWLRATVELTEAQASRDATLYLGAVDEVDQTWINGEVVGSTFGYGTPRTYPLPAEQLRAGENVVVVSVLNTYGAGGLVGDVQRRLAFEGEGGEAGAAPLEGWRYRRARANLGPPPRVPWATLEGLSTIHNGMVAPLYGLSLRGVLWYQGESDTDESQAMYARHVRGLIDQWREQFAARDLPVLVVQLAGYGPPPITPGASGWAAIREAQRRVTEADPHARLAVAIDLGDVYDIHPPNKQEVGRRLAQAARRVVYGTTEDPTGPVPVRAVREDGGGAVRVTFEGVRDSLVAYSADGWPLGFTLCGPAPRPCRYADARIDGDTVVLTTPDGTAPARVRYAWADHPIVNLYDAARRPVVPFELSVED